MNPRRNLRRRWLSAILAAFTILVAAGGAQAQNFISAALNTETGVLEIQFDSTVDVSTLEPMQIHIRETGATSGGFRLNNGVDDTGNVDTPTLLFGLNNNHLRTVREDLTAPQLQFDAATFSDTSGRVFPPVSDPNPPRRLYLTVTGTAPTVTFISAAQPDGALGIGDEVVVTVTFSQPVKVTGVPPDVPQVALDTGNAGGNGAAMYMAGTRGASLTFTYAVRDGDSTTSLDYTTVNALMLNGGTIQSTDDVDATLTLPEPGGSISDHATQHIELAPAALSNNANLMSLSVSNADGGGPISLTPDFDAAVTAYAAAVDDSVTSVTVTPTLADTTAGTTAGFILLMGGLTVTSPVDLTPGGTVITVRVTAEDGVTKDYVITITITRFPADAFVTTWSVDADETVTIPTTGGGYIFSVDWGDGSSNTGLTNNASHTYTVAGDYDISITGTFPQISFFEGSASCDSLQTIVQWGTTQWRSMHHAFRGCENLNIGANAGNPDLSDVTTMLMMFRGATSLNQDISGWDVSTVETMSHMFRGATSFNQDLGAWDVGAVEHAVMMFSGAPLSRENYDALLVGWSGQTVQPNVVFGAGEPGNMGRKAMYCAELARVALTEKRWRIRDDELGSDCDFVAERPTVTGMSAIQDAKYGIGAQVPIVATFSAEVTVDFAGDPTDIPQLELETGADDGVAEYMSGSGGDALTFIYTVVEGHEALPLDSVGSDSLKPKNYGAIRRKNIPGRGRQADLTLPVTALDCPGSGALACSNVLI